MTPAIRVLGCILLVGAVAWLYGRDLDFPPKPYYDEVYHVPSARHVLQGEKYIDVHPPLGHFIHAAGMGIFGDNAWAWRVTSYAAALMLILILFVWVFTATGDRLMAGFAALIFISDGLSVTQGRIMMHNALMLYFMMLSLFFITHALVPGNPNRLRFILCSGICLGLGAATRWVAFSMAPIALLYYAMFRGDITDKRRAGREIAIYLTAALLVYAAAHLSLPFLKGWQWSDIWHTNAYMAKYHLHLTEGHHYGSAWWTWPFMKRPIWYFYQNDHGTVHGILAIGNPLLFWFFIPVVLFTFWKAVAGRDRLARFLLAAVALSWLPWVLLSRVQFFHYFYPVMPFFAVMTAGLLRTLWNQGRWGQITAGLYLAALAGMFLYWYPLLTGYPVSEAYFRQHMWFRSWI